MHVNLKMLFYIISTLLFTVVGIAQERLPGVFTYQGRAFQTDGVTPLSGNATFSVQVRSADGNCLLYQETHSAIDLAASAGFFALNIGDGTAPTGLDMADSFSNLSAAKATLSGTCGGTYTPLNKDSRILRVTVDVGGGPIALDDQYIYTAPQALVADTLSGFKYDQFVQSLTSPQRDALTSMVNGTTIYNITTGRFNRYNGASWLEALGATNLGAGAQVYSSKMTGNDWLQLRSIIGANGVTATQNANDITLEIDSAYTQRRVTGTCSAGNFITGVNANGTVICAADSAGTGTVTSVTAGDTTVTIAGTAADPTVAVNEGNLDLANIGGTLGTSQLANCAADQLLQQNASGTGWTCVAATSLDTNTTYSAGSGLNLTGTTFSVPTDGITSAMVLDGAIATIDIANNAVDSTKLADGAVSTFAKLGAMTCTASQILKRNAGNTAWECATDAGGISSVSVSAPITGDGVGTPLDIAAGGINTAELADDAVTAAKLADGAIDDLAKLAAMTCTASQILKRNAGNTAWECANDTAGTGTVTSVTATNATITIGGTAADPTIGVGAIGSSNITDGSIATIDIANNAIDSTKLADGAVSTLAKLGAMTCTANQVLQRNAGNTAWECAAAATDTDTTYSAGSGLNLTGTTFSVPTDGITSTMILDGTITTTDLSDFTCTGAQTIRRNAGNTAWECFTPSTGGSESTTVSNLGAGTGIYKDMTATQINLKSITATSNKIGITDNANDVGIDVNEANLDLDAIGGTLGYDQLQNCAADQILQQNVSGTAWTCVAASALDTDTTYTAGAGLDLTGTTFSVPIDGITSAMVLDGAIATIDIANNAVDSTKLADGAVSTFAKLAAMTCTASQILKRNAGNTAWECATDAGGISSVSVSAPITGDGVGTPLDIAAGGINTAELADDAVTTVKILDDNVTAAKIADGAIDDTAKFTSLGCTGNQTIRRNAGNTAWECFTPSTGGSESTSVTSLGTGVDVFKQITGTDIELHSVAAGSNKVAVALSSDDITVDVNEANLTLSNIGGQIALSQLPTCTANQILKRNAGDTAWICAADSAGSGTVTSVTAGNTTVTMGGTASDPTVAVNEANLDLDAIGGTLGYDQLANCAADQILQQNVSGTAWTCVAASALDTDTTYTAGSGLDLTGTTFSIPADGVVTTMITDDNVTAAKIADGAIDDTAKLTSLGCTGTQTIRRNAGNTAWECFTPSTGGSESTTVSNVGAGSAIYKDMTGSQINLKSITAGSTKVGLTDNTNDVAIDINEANLTLSNIGGAISLAQLPTCTANQILKRNPGDTAWICAADAGGLSSVTVSAPITGDGAGTPLDIAAGGIDTAELADDAVTTVKILDDNVTAAKIADGAIDDVAKLGAMTCTASQILKRNAGNTAWECAADSTGTGTVTSVTAADTTITIGGTAAAPTVSVDTIVSSNITDGTITTADLSNFTCTGTQTIRRNAGNTAWECFTPSSGGSESTSVTSLGTGVDVFKQITGTDIELRSVLGASNKVTVALSSDDITVDVNEANLDLDAIGGTLGYDQLANCAADQILQQNVSGTAWTCVAASALDTDTTYTAGSGLDLTGTTFSIPADGVVTTMITDDNVTAAKIADGAIDDVAKLGAMTCTASQILKRNAGNTAWECATDAGGISSVSVSAPITGDGVGTPLDIAAGGIDTAELADDSVTADKIADGAIDNVAKLGAMTCTANQVLQRNAGNTAWECAAAATDTDTTYSAGSGLNLTGTTFSVPTDGITSGMVLDGTITTADLSNFTCTGTQTIRRNAGNTAWECFTPSSGGSESTSVTSLGTGVDVFKQITGTDIELRSVLGASNKVTVALSSDDITVDVNEANLTLSNIGGAISLAQLPTCTANQILKRNAGDTAWICAADSAGTGTVTSVTAGNTTVTMGGTASDPTVAVNEGNLDLANIGGTLGTSQLANCAADQILQQNVSGTAWTCVAASALDTDTTYTAGAGLDLTGTTFSVPTDGITSAMVLDGAIATIDIANNAVDSTKLADGAVSTFAKLGAMTCTANQILKRNAGNTAWECATDAGGISSVSVSAPITGDGVGTPLDIAAGGINTAELANDAVTTVKILDDNVTAAKIADGAIDNVAKLGAMTCTASQILKRNAGNTAWECAADNTGTALPAMTNNQIIVSSGTSPAAVTMSGDATIAAGGAITIANDAVTTIKILDDAVTAAKVADGAIDNLAKLAAMGCTGDQIIKRNAGNTAWICAADAGGISSVSVSAPITGDGVGTPLDIAAGGIDTAELANSSVTTVKIADGSVTAAKLADMSCSDGQVLKWSTGSVAWQCQNDAGAGGGTENTSAVNLAGSGQGVFSGQSADELQFRRVASGSSKVGVSLSGNDIQVDVVEANLTLSNIGGQIALSQLPTCTANQILKRNAGDTAWICAADAAGAGTVTSVTAGDTTVTMGGTASDPTVAVNEGNLNLANIGGTLGTSQLANCAADQILQQNVSGTAWTCVAASALDTDTTYTAGSGLNLTGTTFSVPTDGITSAMVLDGAIATADLANSSVTYAKIQNVSATNRLLGRATAGAGIMEEITLGTGLSYTGTTLNVTGSAPTGSAGGDLTGTYPNPTIAGNAVTSAKILDGTIATIDIANNAVDSTKLADGAVSTFAKLGAMTCTASQILKRNAGNTAWECASDAGGISSVNVSAPITGDGVGTPLDIAAGGINTTELANDAVTTVKILDDAVTAAKIADGAIDSLAKLAAMGCTGDQIIKRNPGNTAWICAVDAAGTGTVTSVTATNATITIGGTAAAPTIGVGSIGSSNITDGSIATVDIANNAIDSTKLADGAVSTLAKLGAMTCTANQVLQRNAGNTAWVCAAATTDTDTTYSAGSGLNLTGTTFSIPTSGVTSAMVLDGTITTADLSNFTCTGAQTIRRNAGNTAWECFTPSTGGSESTTVTNLGAGTGIYKDMTATQINLKSITATSNKIGISNNANDVGIDVNEANLTLSNLGGAISLGQLPVCPADQILQQNVSGTAWTCVNPSALSTTYSAGAGLNLTGTTFSIPTSGVTSAMVLDGTLATADLANSSVTYAKMQNVSATNRLLGRATAGAGIMEEITLGTGLTYTGTTLNVSGAAPTGSAGGDLTGTYPNPTIAGNAVTSAKILDGTIATADIADDAVSTNKIANSNVTYGKIQNVSATNRLLGRATAGAGVIEEILLGTGLSYTGNTLNVSGAAPTGSAGGDLTGTYPNPTITGNAVTSAKILDGTIVAADLADGAVTSAKILDGTVATADLANGSVTYAKVQNVSTTNRLLGRATAGAGVMEEITLGTGLSYTGSVLNVTGSAPTGSAGGDLTGTYPNPTITGNAVTSAKILDGTIVAADLADGAVTSAKILDGTITGADLALGTNNTFLMRNNAGTSGAVAVAVCGASQYSAWNGTAWICVNDDTGTALPAMTNNQIIVASGTTPTAATMSGDATIAAGGALTIANNAVTSAKILDGTIATADIANNAIDSTKLANGAVSTLAKLGTMTCTADQILQQNVSGTAWTCVNPSTLDTDTTYSAGSGLNLTGTTFSIPTSGVTSAMVLDGTLATADLANSSVTYAKMQNVSATNRLLGRSTAGAGIVEEILLGTGLSYTGNTLNVSGAAPTGSAGGDLTGTYPNPTIAGNAVTSAKILDGTILAGDLADGAVTSAKILDGTVATADLANSNVTYAKIQDVTMNKILGRYTASTGVVEEITIGSGLSAAGGTLTVTGAAPTGSAGGDLTGTYPNPTIAGNAVTSAKILDGTILAGDLADGAVTSAKILDGTIVAADLSTVGCNDGDFYSMKTGAWVCGAHVDDNTTYSAGAGLNLTGTTFSIPTSGVTSAMVLDGTLATADLANSSVTFAKMQTVTNNRLLGRATAGVGVVEEINLGTGLSYAGTTLSVTGAAPTGSAGGDLTGTYPNPTIAGNAVTGAKILDGTVTTNDIANGTITTTDLNLTNVDARYVLKSGDTVTGSLTVNGSISSSAGVIRDAAGGWARFYGNTGLYSQTYGSGLYFNSNTEIRSYTTARITNVADPTSAQDVATKAYVDSKAGLKVYKSDGTTVLGNHLGVTSADGSSCYGLTYADVTTGAVSQLPVGECSTTTTITAYFSGSSCTGIAYGTSGAGARRFRTGTGNNISICEDAGAFINFYTYSYRTWAGACVNTGGVYQTGAHWRYDVNCANITGICGGSACVVK